MIILQYDEGFFQALSTRVYWHSWLKKPSSYRDIIILLSVKGQAICVYTISPFLELWHLKSCQKCILKMLDMSLLDSEGRYIVSK